MRGIPGENDVGNREDDCLHLYSGTANFLTSQKAACLSVPFFLQFLQRLTQRPHFPFTPFPFSAGHLRTSRSFCHY
jgi:hypothetical protein